MAKYRKIAEYWHVEELDETTGKRLPADADQLWFDTQGRLADEATAEAVKKAMEQEFPDATFRVAKTERFVTVE